uniref:Uncharacterized protein n=1 Tax=viral metagenome TaxID=1070528 RepID=A0A6H1ZQ42_9ZZZZ
MKYDYVSLLYTISLSLRGESRKEFIKDVILKIREEEREKSLLIIGKYVSAFKFEILKEELLGGKEE